MTDDIRLRPESQMTPDLRITRPAGLVPVVVSTLTRRIVQGEFDENSEFPHSADLVDQLGVSRTVIREALRVLEAKQLISIQQGRQTTVLPPDRWDLLDPVVIGALTEGAVSLDVFTELVHVRAALEAEMARVAAERLERVARDDPEASAATRAALVTAYGHLEDAYREIDGSFESAARYLDLDKAFHESVMNLSQNRFGRRIVDQVFVWARGGRGAVLRQGDIDATHVDHQRIFESVRDGRADDAYRAMRSHILFHWAAATRERLEHGTAPEPPA